MPTLNKLDLEELQKSPPNEILEILNKFEGQIKSDLPKSREEDHVGVPIVDWLASQVLFVHEAWKFIKSQGYSDEAGLWILEMLSLPECIRRAKRKWQKKRLIEEALFKRNLRWRDILGCRKKSRVVETYQRNPDFNFFPRQLTPYISDIPCSRKWPNPWGYPRVVEITLQILSSTQSGGPLLPIQTGSSFSFFIQIFTNRGGLILDLPRDYKKNACIEMLKKWRDLLDHHISSLNNDSLPISYSEDQLKIVGLTGWGSPLFHNVRDTPALINAIQKLRNQLEKDMDRLESDKIRPSKRSAIMQKYFHVPQITWVVPVSTIPSDLSPGLLGMVLGAWLSEHYLLSRKGKRSIRRFIEQKILVMNPEMTVDKVRQLDRKLLKRLGQFNRPLRGRSIHSYLRYFSRQGELSKQWEILEGDMGHYKEDVKQIPFGTILKRIPKGERLRLAQRLGCNPKTISRHFRSYREERGFKNTLETWKRFKKKVCRK